MQQIVLSLKKNKLLSFLLVLLIIYIPLTSYFRGATKDLDFKVFYTVAQRVQHHDIQIYDYHKDGIFSFKYSPFSAILFTPLAQTSKQSAQKIWSFFSVIATCLSFIMAWRLLLHYKNIPSKYHIKILLLSLFMVIRPILNNATQGNINSILLFICLAAVYLSVIYNYSVLPALLLAIAISIKLIPMALLGFFIFSKRYKVVLWTVALTLLFFLIPFLYWSTEETLQLYHNWILILQDKQHFPFFKWTNQSPQVVWFHLTKSHQWGTVIFYLHFPLLLLLLHRAIKLKNNLILLSLCFITILLASPVVWIEYFLMMMLPVMVLSSTFFLTTSKKWKTLFIIRIIITYGFGRFMVGNTLANTINNYGQLYWGAILALILIFWQTETKQVSMK